MDVLGIIASICLISVGCLGENGRAQDLEGKRAECFAHEKVYYQPADKCYKLLTKGPCRKGQWFVLEKPNDLFDDHGLTIEGECVEEKCMDGEYYWPETNSCVRPNEAGMICSEEKNEVLQYSPFGEGECACRRDPPSARLYNSLDNPCHPLYRQGPCRTGEVLGFRNIVSDEPECIVDPCYQVSVERKRSGTLAPQAILALWGNQTCYELGTEGPCPKGMTFRVHSKHMRPSCVSLTNHYFDFSRGCYPDENGKCQELVVTKAEDFRVGLLGAYRAQRRRKLLQQMKKENKTDSAVQQGETPSPVEVTGRLHILNPLLLAHRHRGSFRTQSSRLYEPSRLCYVQACVIDENLRRVTVDETSEEARPTLYGIRYLLEKSG